MTNRDTGELDAIDTAVYTNTIAIRRQYVETCERLKLEPRTLSPIVIGMRSVTP